MLQQPPRARPPLADEPHLAEVEHELPRLPVGNGTAAQEGPLLQVAFFTYPLATALSEPRLKARWAVSATISAIASDDVAAGDGAFRTCSVPPW